jgi:hypothetical protein
MEWVMADDKSTKWYLVATCKNPDCKHQIELMECPPPSVNLGVDREQFEYQCAVCNKSYRYTMFEVTRQQGATRH